MSYICILYNVHRCSTIWYLLFFLRDIFKFIFMAHMFNSIIFSCFDFVSFLLWEILKVIYVYVFMLNLISDKSYIDVECGVSFDIIVRFGIFFFSFVEYLKIYIHVLMINLIRDKSYINVVQCGICLLRYFFFSSVGYLKLYMCRFSC